MSRPRVKFGPGSSDAARKWYHDRTEAYRLTATGAAKIVENATTAEGRARLIEDRELLEAATTAEDGTSQEFGQ